MGSDRSEEERKIAKYRHEQLRIHLSLKGYDVYPRELLCAMPWSYNPLSIQERYRAAGYIDAAAFKDGHYYGFEYKSISDNVSRAILQCEAYILSFDYVIVVCERNLTTKSKYWHKLADIGVGIWRITYTQKKVHGILQPDIIVQINEKLEPKLQTPHPERRKWVHERFHRYVWKDFNRRIPVIPENQKRLTEF